MSLLFRILTIAAVMLLVLGMGCLPALADEAIKVSFLQDGAYYTIRNAASGRCLSYAGGLITLGGPDDCVWRARKVGSQWYFSPETKGNAYLNCYLGKQAASGSQARLYASNPVEKDTASLWKVEWSADGKARLINAASGYVLGAPQPIKKGSAVNVYKAGAAVNAAWTFENMYLSDAIGDHYAFALRDRGSLKFMRGKIHFIVVFVSTPQHPWTDAKRREVYNFCDSSIRIMEKGARSYGTDLKLTYGVTNVSLPYEVDSDSQWAQYIAKNNFNKNSVAEVIDHFRDHGTYRDAPVLFMFNSEGRSHSVVANWEYPDADEYCVFYCGGRTHSNYLSHEVFHLYGAIDLYDYNHEGVARVSSKYFPKSNMQCTGDDMDPLTAYLLGWTDALNEKAVAFLQETIGLR